MFKMSRPRYAHGLLRFGWHFTQRVGSSPLCGERGSVSWRAYGTLLDIGKETYMQEKGYEWVSKFDAYINHGQWKIFTRTYLDDHTFDDILVRLEDEPVSGQCDLRRHRIRGDIHNIRRHYGTPA